MGIRTYKGVIDPAASRYDLDLVNELCDLASMDEVNLRIPDGVYTTFRTYNLIQAIGLDKHFLRLKESLFLTNHSSDINNKLLREAIRFVLGKASAGNELRIRITLPFSPSNEFYVTTEPLSALPATVYQEGVKVITGKLRRSNARAKSTSFISPAHMMRSKLPADVNEMIMLDQHGNFLEGLSSNFFGVSNGEVWTAETGVLQGITRQIVLDALSEETNLVLHLNPLNISNTIQEAFLTSVSRGVLPIRQIDDLTLDAPGSITRQAMNLYSMYLEKYLETI